MNVSRDEETQAETTVAIHPRNPRRLVAAAVDWTFGVMSWTSRDGGRTWLADDQAPVAAPGCVDADPALAFDSRGRAYLAVLGRSDCDKSGPERVFVARRENVETPWVPATAPLAPGPPQVRDDKPAIAVDLGPRSPFRNRIYAAWARWERLPSGYEDGAIVITHSGDGGRTWSPLSRVSPASQLAFSASLAISPDGEVYVVWDDPRIHGIWIDRSRDGVRFGADRLVATYLPVPRIEEQCDVEGARIPAQPRRCVGPNPIATVDPRPPLRVQVTYGNVDDADDSQSVFLVAFDRMLRKVIGGAEVGVRITPPEPKGFPADQFWPVSAFDGSRKRLWACYYDTTGDRSRRTASYSCMLSRDRGRTWLGPARVASVPSNETQPRAERFEYGDYQGLAVSAGIAHPVWTDSRLLSTAREEIFTAALTETDIERAVSRRAGR